MQLFRITGDDKSFACEIPFDELTSWGIMGPQQLMTQEGQAFVTQKALDFAIENHYATPDFYTTPMTGGMKVHPDRGCIVLQVKSLPAESTPQCVMSDIINQIINAADTGDDDDETLEIVPNSSTPRKSKAEKTLLVIRTESASAAIDICKALVRYKFGYDMSSCEVFSAEKGFILCLYVDIDKIDLADGVAHEFCLDVKTEGYRAQNGHFSVVDHFKEMYKQIGTIQKLSEI